MHESVKKAPLYRKVNTRARHVHHHFGGDYRHVRNREDERRSDRKRGAMAKGVKRGLDYTPLYRFLLSKVGQDWDDVFREARGRLDKVEPIFWMVALREEDERDYVCIGESSAFSGLRVDENNCLVKVNPGLGPETFQPWCACCTFTFNSVRVTTPWQQSTSFSATSEGDV